MQPERMRPQIKVAIITGAGGGIGRALALEASRRGIKLLLAGRRRAPLEETAALVGGAVSVEIQPCDVTDAGDRGRLIGEAETLFGKLDYLVNNAGAVAVGRFVDMPAGEIERLAAVNLAAPAALIQQALPLLRRAQGARIVNVGSMFGAIGFPRFAAYSASKFALRGLSDALRRELSADGIGVTYAAPRATRTPAAERFADLVEPMGMTLDPPERVARRLWDAVEAGRDRVTPGVGESLALLVQSLAPRLVDRKLMQIEARLRQACPGEEAAAPLATSR